MCACVCVLSVFRREADYFLPAAPPTRLGGGPPMSTLILSNLLGWTRSFVGMAIVLGDPLYAPPHLLSSYCPWPLARRLTFLLPVAARHGLSPSLGDTCLSYPLFLIDYLKGAIGMVDREGMVMESAMYGQVPPPCLMLPSSVMIHPARCSKAARGACKS